MKRNVLSLVLTILTFASLICTFSITASAEDTATPSVTIGKFNLVFEDNVYLKYAVKFNGIDDNDINSSNIGMLYFTEPQSEYIEGNENYSSSVVGHTTIDEQKYYTFEYRHISAKQMTDYIYSVAYIDIDGGRIYSEPVKYSVLDYCYSKLGKTGVASENEDFKTLLSMTLEQGAAAQKYFKYNTDRLANDEYYLVEVVGGALEDGFTKGLYHAGETAILTASETSNDLTFAGWENALGEVVSTDLIYNITEFQTNQTYIATYEDVIKYSEGLEFTSNGDGTCYVSGIGTCTDTDIVIPPTSPDGDSVTEIGDNAFACEELVSVTIPNSVTSIDDWAFAACNSLSNVIIPNSVTSIGGNAFVLCASLTSIVIPDSVTEIGEAAFAECLNLESVIIGNNVTSIAGYAFQNCTSLTNVTIPDSVEFIGRWAFWGCTSLTSISISDNVVNIGSEVFYGCTSLKTINVDAENTNYQSIDGNLYTKDGKTLIQYAIGKKDTEFIIPNSVTSISYGAFYYCTNLTRITIPDSVITIGSDVFSECTSLESVTIPDNVTEIGEYAFFNCQSLTSVTIGDSVTTIGDRAFYGCISLESITIPDGVTKIGGVAFYGCDSLRRVYYSGNKQEWSNISIGSYNDDLKDATRYYYSENHPTEEGNFWHWVEGEPTVWK